MREALFVLIEFIALCGMGWAIMSLIRNNEVYKFCHDLGEEVGRLAKEDIDAEREWQWRFDILRKRDYEAMVLKFWVPLEPENWFEDLSFLRPGERTVKG